MRHRLWAIEQLTRTVLDRFVANGQVDNVVAKQIGSSDTVRAIQRSCRGFGNALIQRYDNKQRQHRSDSA
jgi:hypothetical protein